jgi:hypothetical protein
MDLTKIVSISGKTGLFKVVSQGKNAVIVESLADQKRFPAFGHEKMSSLEEISVFTTGDDRPLKDIFKAFHEKLEGKETPDPKSDNNALLKFFSEMMPDFDKERVYVSDIRKMMNWYNLLLAHNLLDFTEEPEEKAETAEAKETEADQPAADAEVPGEATEPVIKPEKKTPRKKKSE